MSNTNSNQITVTVQSQTQTQTSATPKTPAVPAYQAFCAQLLAKCEELGLPKPESANTETGLPQNEGYVFLRWAGNDAALIIPKSKGRMADLDSHLDLVTILSGSPSATGAKPLSKKNGRVLCKFSPDALLSDSTAAAVLPLFADSGTGRKRPVIRPASTKAATVTATPVQPIATITHTPSDFEAEAALYAQATEEQGQFSETEMTDEEMEIATRG